MKGNKVTCATCANEKDKKCVVKKATVAMNKRRKCDSYVLEATKIKARQVLKTVKMGYKEKEALRREYKAQLKQLKAATKEGYMTTGPQSGNSQHPLTGDLSRFTSTVGSEDNGK